MSDPAETKSTVKKTISLTERCYRRAEEAAAREHRSFSNYIAQLILADEKAGEAPSEQRVGAAESAGGVGSPNTQLKSYE